MGRPSPSSWPAAPTSSSRTSSRAWPIGSASAAGLAPPFIAFGGVNAALVHRFRTGRGQHLDVSLLASTMALLPDPVAIYFDTGVRPGRWGNRNPNLTPAEAFRTRDGHGTIVLINSEQWGRFCAVPGD